MLMSKNVNNDVSKDSPIAENFTRAAKPDGEWEEEALNLHPSFLMNGPPSPTPLAGGSSNIRFYSVTERKLLP